MAYHNTQRMGRSLQDGDPLNLLTDRPVEQLRGNVVWFIVGEGAPPKRYSLGSVFVVEKTGDAGDRGFRFYAKGSDENGHAFEPEPALNDLVWFPDFFRSTAHFSLGVQEIKDPRFIDALLGLGAEFGYVPA